MKRGGKRGRGIKERDSDGGDREGREPIDLSADKRNECDKNGQDHRPLRRRGRTGETGVKNNRDEGQEKGRFFHGKGQHQPLRAFENPQKEGKKDKSHDPEMLAGNGDEMDCPGPLKMIPDLRVDP